MKRHDKFKWAVWIEHFNIQLLHPFIANMNRNSMHIVSGCHSSANQQQKTPTDKHPSRWQSFMPLVASQWIFPFQRQTLISCSLQQIRLALNCSNEASWWHVMSRRQHSNSMHNLIILNFIWKFLRKSFELNICLLVDFANILTFFPMRCCNACPTSRSLP